MNEKMWTDPSYYVQEPEAITNALIAYVERLFNLPIMSCTSVDDN